MVYIVGHICPHVNRHCWPDVERALHAIEPVRVQGTLLQHLEQEMTKGSRSSPLFNHALADLSRSHNLAWCQLFFDTCRLAGAIAQVVQLGTAYVAATLHFDAFDRR